MLSSISVLSPKIIARQVRRYAYCVALLCALFLIWLALFAIEAVERIFKGTI